MGFLLQFDTLGSVRYRGHVRRSPSLYEFTFTSPVAVEEYGILRNATYLPLLRKMVLMIDSVSTSCLLTELDSATSIAYPFFYIIDGCMQRQGQSPDPSRATHLFRSFSSCDPVHKYHR